MPDVGARKRSPICIRIRRVAHAVASVKVSLVGLAKRIPATPKSMTKNPISPCAWIGARLQRNESKTRIRSPKMLVDPSKTPAALEVLVANTLSLREGRR